MRRATRLALLAAAVAATTALSACGGSSGGGGGNPTGPKGPNGAAAAYNAAYDKVVNPSTKAGGTLKLLAASDCDSWDPQRTYYGWCWNLQRLITRSLIGYQTVNGTSYKLAPDLATDMGKHNADFTQWTYTLKSGLKFSNGKAITPMDVKYGVERLFATDVINGGPSSYFTQGISAPKDYKGPYKSGDLSTITTTGNSITFNLASPNADFDYLMAMPASGAVPYKVEGGAGFTGASYTKRPVASGPFMIKSYTQNQSVVLVRNPNWTQSSDTIHHPLVDEVDLTVDTDPVDIDQKLEAGTADARADNGVSAALQAKMLTNPTLKKQGDDPVASSTRYMSVMQSVITNADCRKAIFYAFDKAAFVTAYGGTVAGEIAGSMTPPGIPGYDQSYDPYPSGSDGHGDVAKAKAALQACGKPDGFSTKFAYGTPSTRAVAAFKAEQVALARVGIKITAVTSDSSNYYSTFIGSPANVKSQGIGLAIAGWGADFPTGTGFYQSIANGNSILPTGNSNYASLNDPTVNSILDAAPKGKTTEADWKKLNQAVMDSTVYLPVLWQKTLYWRGSRLTNVTCNNALAFGIYDWVNAGVS